MGKGNPWKWLVLLFMALGLLVIDLLVPGDFEELFRPVALFVGLTWLGSGAATLCLYIRHTQAPVLETQ
jgi:membrane-bound ClpP family serine protease